MEKKETLNIDRYVEIALKRRWYIVLPFCLAMIAGICLAVKLPKIYKASTLILVEPQRVPTSYVQTLVSTGIDARISTISQQILSRSNLEKIINEFGLFSSTKYKDWYLEDKLEDIRKRIDVSVTRARQGADAFSISFEGKEPEKVMKVVNTLATYFIDANLKVREDQAVGTSDFLDGELETMRKRLEEVERSLKSYRERYIGELPEQLETNLRVLDRLQVQLGEKQINLRDSKNRLANIENQLSEVQKEPLRAEAIGVQTGGPTTLEQLKNQLRDLKSRYTDKHPDIIRLKSMIADFEGKASPDTIDSNEGILTPQNRVVKALVAQREDVRLELRTLELEISDLNSQIMIYQNRVENTPKREQELLTLKRDYQNIQSTYNSLLGRRLEAEIAVNMERKQKGEQFRILDFAKVPGKPVKPNMKKLFMIIFVGGLGIGLGLILLLEYFDSSFKDTEDLEAQLGLPVLATIPIVLQPSRKFRRKIDMAVFIVAVFIAIALFFAFAVTAVKGM